MIWPLVQSKLGDMALVKALSQINQIEMRDLDEVMEEVTEALIHQFADYEVP